MGRVVMVMGATLRADTRSGPPPTGVWEACQGNRAYDRVCFGSSSYRGGCQRYLVDINYPQRECRLRTAVQDAAIMGRSSPIPPFSTLQTLSPYPAPSSFRAWWTNSTGHVVDPEPPLELVTAAGWRVASQWSCALVGNPSRSGRFACL